MGQLQHLQAPGGGPHMAGGAMKSLRRPARSPTATFFSSKYGFHRGGQTSLAIPGDPSTSGAPDELRFRHNDLAEAVLAFAAHHAFAVLVLPADAVRGVLHTLSNRPAATR